MEMEESEGHISIQIASILSAIHPAGSSAADFLLWAPLDLKKKKKDLFPWHITSHVVPGSSHPVSAATSLGWIQLHQRRCGFLWVAKVKLASAQAVCRLRNAH